MAHHNHRKILVILGDFQVGGGQIAGVRLANALAAQNQVYLANARPHISNDQLYSLISPSVTVIPNGDYGNRSQSSYVKYLCDEIRSVGIDLIHTHIWWADRIAIEIRSTLDVAWVSTLHGCQEYLALEGNAYADFNTEVRRFYERVDGVAYLAAKNLICARLNGIRAFVPVRRIFNCLDAPPLVADDKRGNGQLRFVLTSRAIEEKGWDRAIEALALLREAGFTGVTLDLIGDGPYLEGARERARALHVSGQISFRGYVEEPFAYLKNCDVGILPSRFVSESLPNSVAEYMAAGLPVIASDIGAVADMIVRSGPPCGVVLTQDGRGPTAADLASAMRRYIDDDALRYIHGRNAVRRYKCLFDPQYVASQYNSLFEEALSVRSTLYTRSAATPLLPNFLADQSVLSDETQEAKLVEVDDAEIRTYQTIPNSYAAFLPGRLATVLKGLVYYDDRSQTLCVHPHKEGAVYGVIGPFRRSSRSTQVSVEIETLSPFSGAVEYRVGVVEGTLQGFIEAYSGSGEREIRTLIRSMSAITAGPLEPVVATLDLGDVGSEWCLVCSTSLGEGASANYARASIVSVRVHEKC